MSRETESAFVFDSERAERLSGSNPSILRLHVTKRQEAREKTGEREEKKKKKKKLVGSRLLTSA